ncbi:MAG TPA: BTAD domain-containing putative transcriptional regulator [Actinomycetota bacterium]|nr:BTAD domain-containing putative transcriptional regulator [Actinomycetota bacterium]
MRLEIHVLGRPRIERNGAGAGSPKGRKPWALLACLLLADRPPSRQALAELLFTDADDPLGTLRWNLAELRRLLGEEAQIEGDPVVLSLPTGSYVDVRTLTGATWVEAMRVPGLGRELLEGMSFPRMAAFEAWLLTQRRHLLASAEAVLREATLARLASGQAEESVALAMRLVASNPLEESFQELFIRSLVAAGDHETARRQLDACIQLFERELGVKPGPGVLGALEARPQARTSVRGVASARARLEAGEAAVGAGAWSVGLQELRAAAAEATATGDRWLEARALSALGSALVHAARGRDEEGATALHAAISITDETGDTDVAATARVELAWIEMLRGRYERALLWLDQADEFTAEAPAERARIQAVRGICYTDTGAYGEGIGELMSSIRVAEAAGDEKQVSFSLAFLGRARLLCGERHRARELLDRSLGLARSLGWTSFAPWPEAFLAEVARQEGKPDEAARVSEHAFALACQLGDPCWEGVAARGMGLAQAGSEDGQGAIERLEDASIRCVRVPDAYLWVRAYCLDALCEVAIPNRALRARAWVQDLESLAARTGMREFLARAYLHREALGDDSARQVAVVIGKDVDNPVLEMLLGG